jgi:hypothetical protein
MAKEQSNPEDRWDRDQWAKDETADTTSTEQGETWNRDSWASGEKHPDSPGDDVTTATGHSQGETGPTGRNMQPGEGHWERVDKES